MNQENRLWKWSLIVVLIALALLAVVPPREKLKPGIDLAGGTSLIYEIDMTGLEKDERTNLADRVMNILKARVDPNSQFNLVWRPIGNNRLEIQMPRPPQEARERRQQYEAARDKIRDLNVTRNEIEQALLLAGTERDQALEALVHGVEGRAALLQNVAKAWDAYAAARGSGDIAQEVDTHDAYEASLEAIEATSLPVGRVTDVLGLPGGERAKELELLKKQHPAYVAAIEQTVTEYDNWSKKRGSLEDAADLKRLLRGAGVLEFRILAERDAANPAMLKDPNDASYSEPLAKYTDQLAKRGPRPKAGDVYAWYEIEDLVKFSHADNLEQAKARLDMGSVVIAPYAGKYYVLAYVDDGSQRYGLTKSSKKWSLKRATPSRDQATGRPNVLFQLDPRGGVQFADVTRLNINRELAIFLDGLATSHATIQSQISEHGVITGRFTQERVMEIVRKLEAGSLPARLKEMPLQEKYIGPALGTLNRDRALKAAAFGFVAVAVYMLIYYVYLGVLADIALTLNVLFVLAVMAAMEATFTLPGVAGVALTIGMAVDANVLINERIREELRRGVGLKKAIKLGYDKALAAIVDSNLTTLISCVILGYVGSEEIKGFAMTLGFGVVISMFTALFVTHLILNALVDHNLVKRLPMLGLIPPTKIDWFGLRKHFWTVSLVILAVGVGFFTWQAAHSPAAVFDIELLGGSSVQVELADGVDMDREAVLAAVTGQGGSAPPSSAASWLREAADKLEKAAVEPVADASGEFRVTAEGLSPVDVNIMLLTSFERSLARGGFTAEGNSARFRTQTVETASEETEQQAEARDTTVDLAAFKAGVAGAATYVREAATRIADARVLAVAETGAALVGTRTFEVVTVESNKELLRAAVLGAMGDKLKVERRIDYTLVTDPERAPDGLFPVREDDNFLGDVLGFEAPIDIRAFKGGVVFLFDQLDPPQTLADLERRFREMRLQPQFEEHGAREEKILGLTEAGAAAEANPRYSRVAVVVEDEELMFSDDPAAWEVTLAKPELSRAREALGMEKSMSKVVQFAPQMAKGTQQQAFISIVLAMIGIILYLWFRFGTMQYGLAAIVALVFDVGIVLGVIAVGEFLEVGNLKVDLAMIAAILTVIGYSVNDKIVVFDRVRENLGKLKVITVPVINNSINGTLSRTVLTGGTVLMTMLLMYIFGGSGVRGFCLVMLVGVTIGTFSSIAIAAPLLNSRRLTHSVVYCMAAAFAILVTFTLSKSTGVVIGVAAVSAVLVGLLMTIERRTDVAQPGTAVPA